MVTFAFTVDVLDMPDDLDDPLEVEDLDLLDSALDAAFSSSSFFFFQHSWALCPLKVQ